MGCAVHGAEQGVGMGWNGKRFTVRKKRCTFGTLCMGSLFLSGGICTCLEARKCRAKTLQPAHRWQSRGMHSSCPLDHSSHVNPPDEADAVAIPLLHVSWGFTQHLSISASQHLFDVTPGADGPISTDTTGYFAATKLYI